MKKLIGRGLVIALLVLFVLLLLGGGWFAYLRFGPEPGDPGLISASGTIEALEVDVCPEVGGRIVSLRVNSGDQIKAGQIVAVLDQSQFQAQVEGAKAALARAQARLSDLEAGAREEEKGEAAAALEQAQVNRDRAAREWERVVELYEAGAVSEQERDRAQAALELAGAQLKAAEQRLALVEAGTRPGVLAQAREDVRQARATLTQAEVALSRTVIRAPVDGNVLLKNFEVGEIAAAGAPIITLGDLRQMWLRLYLPEPDLGRIRLGQKVEITVDSFPDRRFWGKITEISQEAEFTPKFVQTKKERVNLVFAIKVSVPNPDGLLKPGMPADAVIRASLKDG
ncbi:MAG: efflux RND transporter periplasmic adaptor subunit [Bacillota bacterium]|nr:efflux RND transporter periplasmic adaptor subunit [Bacillota bacterium]